MKSTLAFLLIISSSVLNAQTSDTAAVRVASLDYIHAFYYGDTIKMYRSISPNVFKYGYSRPKDSASYNANGQIMTWQQIIDYVRRVASRPANPNMANLPQKVELLEVQDKTAATKVTAWWGTDYLLLAKNEVGNWIILQVLWQAPPPKK